MQRIKKQLPDGLEISDIYMEDIHGLGNDTMVVLAVNNDGGKNANQFLIFDKVDNDILNQFNNLLGYGSNYRLSYLFSLESPYDEDVRGYSLEILDTIDLTGDLSKEIIVKFMPYPAGNGAYYQIGIFTYSYEKHTYYLLGTYPEAILYEANELISTIFHEEGASDKNYYNQNEVFELEYSSKYNNDFFMETNLEEVVLVRTERIWGDESNADPHRFTVSLFEPVYDSEIDELRWRVLFSEETDEYIEYCTQEYVQKFLKEKNGMYGY